MTRMVYEPLKEALMLAGTEGLQDMVLYQDYLYALLSDGSNAKPITEEQWEAMVSIIGVRHPFYASSLKHALSNLRADRKPSKDQEGGL